MFNFNPREAGSIDGNSSPTALNSGTQSTLEADIDYFGPCPDLNLYGAEDVQRAHSFTTSPNQWLDFARKDLESPVSSSDGPPAMAALRTQSFPGREDKVLVAHLPAKYRETLTDQAFCR